MKDAYKAIATTSTMVVACIIAVWLGNFLDGIFDTSPWILFILLGYAIGASLYYMVKKLGGEHDGN